MQTFFEREAQLHSESPESFSRKLRESLTQANYDASVFLAKTTREDDPEYKPALRRFVGEFEVDRKKVYQHFEDEARKRYFETELPAIQSQIDADTKKQTAAFMKKLSQLDTATIRELKDRFQSNTSAIEPFYRQRATAAAGLVLRPQRDLDYEASLTEGYTPATKIEFATVAHLRTIFETAWSLRGYTGDADLYKKFQAENLPISGTSQFKPRA